MLKMIAKPLFLVMCAAMSFTAPMDICMAQDKQETLGQSVKEQIPFTLGYLTTTSHLLAFIAKEEGYFAEEGLDVELIPFASAGELATGLEVGKLNVALIGSVPSITKAIDYPCFYRCIKDSFYCRLRHVDCTCNLTNRRLWQIL